MMMIRMVIVMIIIVNMVRRFDDINAHDDADDGDYDGDGATHGDDQGDT